MADILDFLHKYSKNPAINKAVAIFLAVTALSSSELKADAVEKKMPDSKSQTVEVVNTKSAQHELSKSKTTTYRVDGKSFIVGRSKSGAPIDFILPLDKNGNIDGTARFYTHKEGKSLPPEDPIITMTESNLSRTIDFKDGVAEGFDIQYTQTKDGQTTFKEGMRISNNSGVPGSKAWRFDQEKWDFKVGIVDKKTGTVTGWKGALPEDFLDSVPAPMSFTDKASECIRNYGKGPKNCEEMQKLLQAQAEKFNFEDAKARAEIAYKDDPGLRKNMVDLFDSSLRKIDLDERDGAQISDKSMQYLATLLKNYGPDKNLPIKGLEKTRD